VAELENALQRQKLDHEREKHFNRETQIHEMELMNEITRMNALMVSPGKAFGLVFI
jgi:hypothetical protein